MLSVTRTKSFLIYDLSFRDATFTFLELEGSSEAQPKEKESGDSSISEHRIVT